MSTSHSRSSSTDTVVGDRQPLERAESVVRSRSVALDGDQHVAVGLHDLHGIRALRLFDDLVAGDDAAQAIDEDRAAGPIGGEGLLQCSPTAGRTAIGVTIVGDEVFYSPHDTDRLFAGVASCVEPFPHLRAFEAA